MGQKQKTKWNMRLPSRLAMVRQVLLIATMRGTACNKKEHEAPETKNKKMDIQAPEMEMEGKGEL